MTSHRPATTVEERPFKGRDKAPVTAGALAPVVVVALPKPSSHVPARDHSC
ncbi:MAG: hypothetical protein WA485_01295 [Candidatus Sulfotelmatobacter sp.]